MAWLCYCDGKKSIKSIMNNNTKIILGMIAAGVAGAAIGMLLAPQKGSDVRGSIRQGIDELGEKIADFVNDKTDRIRGAADEFKHDVDILKHDAKTAADHGKQVVS